MTFNTLTRGLVGAGVALATLSACAPKSVAIPNYFYDFAVQTAVADKIAAECPSLTTDEAQKTAAMRGMQGQFVLDGYSPEQVTTMTTSVDPAVVRTKYTALVSELNLADETSASYCKAGRAQIAQNTGVGSFLKEAR